MSFLTDIFTSMLSPWQWLLMGLIPPAIVALYFLKLRRQPLEVPSTYLWRRTIEDMHVNSLWQRLRQNLLLLLQLLLIGLLMLACLRPSFKGKTALKNRLIFLVDVSASMTATDTENGDSRLDVAKEKVEGYIEQMEHGDAAMLMSFADRVIQIQPFTTDKRLLRNKLAAVKPTQRTSDISEALRAAAGLANPGRSGDKASGDTATADALPAEVLILSDGGCRTIPEFSWGNLSPRYVPMGEPESTNVAITAFSSQINSSKPDQMEAFAEIQNFSASEKNVRISLTLNDVFLDAAEAKVAAGEIGGVNFRFDKVPEGNLKVTIDEDDQLMADNAAFSAINKPRQAKLLMVTDGNDALEQALATSSSQELAEVSMIDVAGMADESFSAAAARGDYDVIIFDRCQPPGKSPACNTLYINSIPPNEFEPVEGAEENEEDSSETPSLGWRMAEEDYIGPQIIDIENLHPLMKYVNFGDVRFVRCRPIKGPPGARILVESDATIQGIGGGLIAVAPRQGFEDVVLGFSIIGEDEDGNVVPNTDWPIRYSFPLFFKNALQYLGSVGSEVNSRNVLPGEVVPVRMDGGGDQVTITTPSGESFEVNRDRAGAYLFADTDEVGIYQVASQSGDRTQSFAVNLFDPVESDIVPKEFIETTYDKVNAETQFEPTRRDFWRWVLVLAVIVLVAEWYIYNRRVYL